jgi:hypothetical protein
MVQTSTPGLESLLEKIQQDEARQLYPRLILYEALAVFRDKHQPRQPSKNAMCETRRDFLDSFAYMCDVQKGGKTVTAAALQKLLHSDFLWLAANEGISEDVLEYAKNALRLLKSVTLDNQSVVKNDVFKLVVHKCAHRIQVYKSKVQSLATECKNALQHKKRDQAGMFGLGYDKQQLTCVASVENPL